MKLNAKSPSLFPSDFFSSGDEKNKPQKTSTINQPILPINTNISVLPPRANQSKNIPSKVIIDFQKEFDEDKELLQMLQGESTRLISNPIITYPGSNSEGHALKPFSSRPKRLNKKQVECEIIPEEDEEKMRTSTKIFYEDKAGNKNNANNYNTNNNNLNISPQKKKPIKAIERNNDSLSTTNVTYDSMKPKSKMKRRYYSGESKTSKMNILAVNYHKPDIPTNSLKQLVLPSIKKKNPYIEYQKKFESLFDNLGEFSEEEHIKPQLNLKMKNIGDIQSVLMKKTMQRGKMGSAPHGDANYLKKSSSTSNIPHINKSKISSNNNYQQLSKMNITKITSINNINIGKVNPSPNKYDKKKESTPQMISHKLKQLPVKVISK